MALIDNILFAYSCNDDAANTTVVDGTGTQNGTLAGGNDTEDLNTPAKLGDGFNLDGTADYVNANQNLNANTTIYSFQKWINFDDLDSNSTLFSTDTDNTGTRGFQCLINPDGAIQLFDGTSSYFSATGLISASTDHHIIFVLNGSSSKVYIDGVLRLNASASFGNVSKPLIIGQRSSTTPQNFIDGVIDEADGWTKALTDGGVALNITAGGEVAQLYNSGNGLAYPFTTTETKTSTGNSRIEVPTQITKTGQARIEILDFQKTSTGNSRIEVADNQKTSTGNAYISTSKTKTSIGTARIEVEQQKTSQANSRIEIDDIKITKLGTARIEVADNQKTSTGNSRIEIKQQITKTGTARIQINDIEEVYDSDARIEVADNQITKPGNSRIEIEYQITKTGQARIEVPTQITKTGNSRIEIEYEETYDANSRIEVQFQKTKRGTAFVNIIDDFKPIVNSINSTKPKIISTNDAKPTIRSAETFN